MGAGFSSQNGVAIRTSRTVFVPGDTVEGIVALNCVDAIEVSGLKLEVWFFLTAATNTFFFLFHELYVLHTEQSNKAQPILLTAAVW